MAKQKAKVGQLVKIVANTSHHNYTRGEVYRVVSSPNGYIQAESLDCSWKGNNMNTKDYEIVNLTKEFIKSEIQELQNEIDHKKSIIAWMDENGRTEYDPNEHKVWKALTTIESDSISKIDKVKLIAALLK